MTVVAAFGSLAFEVTPSMMKQFKNLKQTAGYRSDNNDNKGRKPATVRKGAELQKLTFDVELSALLGVDVSVEKQKWIDVAESGVPYPFTVAGGRISKYPFLCKTVDVSYEEHSGTGKPIKVVLSISLEEYVDEGTDETTSSGSSAVSVSSLITSSSTTTSAADFKTLDTAYGSADTDKKRNNPEKEKSQKSGVKTKSNAEKIIKVWRK